MLPPLIVEISGTKCGSKLNCSAVRVRVDQAGEGGISRLAMTVVFVC